MKIHPPRHSADHPDRALECAFALEPAFAKLEADAMAAGWTSDEVAIALMDLAKGALLALAENRRSQAAIDVARLLDEMRKRDA